MAKLNNIIKKQLLTLKNKIMETYLLKENVLTDDLIHIPENGKVFKGNYIAILEIFTFLNSWSDKKNIKRFRSNDQLDKFLAKNYPNFNY